MRILLLLVFAFSAACHHDPPPADFHEVAGASSDGYGGGAPAATGLTLKPGGSFTIAGTIDGANANETRADSDMYQFTVAADTLVRAELTWSKPIGPVRALAILAPDFTPVVSWTIGNMSLLTRPTLLPAGSYLVHVTAALPAPSDPESYLLKLNAQGIVPCDASAAAPSYSEAESAPRANDALSMNLTGFPEFEPAPATGAPESTGLTIAAGAPVVIAGSALGGGYPIADENVPDPGGDDYRDRDVFQFTAGAGVTELQARVDPAQANNADFDLYLFGSNDFFHLHAAGTSFDLGSDGLLAQVTAGQRYWLAVAAHDQFPAASPAAYRVTLCAR